MRALLTVWLAIPLALTLVPAGPSAAEASSSCAEATCGVPKCWEPTVRVRPDVTRAVSVYCYGATRASLVTAPAHVAVSNVTVDYSGLHFDARPEDGAPRWDEAVFEIGGYDGSIQQRVSIEVVPTSENSPPICSGDHVTQRSDGKGPVDVYLHPWCRDPDGDDFVITGGPPGVHGDSPKTVPAGSSDSNWRYRTATFSGDETTTIWATDSLGARSEDAQLQVTVGPNVDRPPECGWSGNLTQVYSRPGATRRFALMCTDPDGDPFTTRLSDPPERGLLTLFDVGDPSSGWWGTERWIDAAYVPRDDSLEPDPFTMTATGAKGDGPVAHMAIVPHALPYNSGGGCGWNPTVNTFGLTGKLWMSCSDDDGDPLSTEIETPPRHGTLAPAVITPSRYGNDDINIEYVPDPGYEGYDCVTVKVTDGHGLVFDLSFDIWVRPAPVQVVPPPLPPTPLLPPVPPLPIGDAGQPVGVQDAVEQALGTKAVKRLGTYGGAQVWARSTLSRHDLVRWGRAPGLVVVCSKRCQIRSDAKLATGVRSVRSARRSSVAAAASGQPQVLSLRVTRAERRALRHARKPRAKFSVSIRPAGGRKRSIASSIRVSR
jgi:hypothetical protein